MRNIVQTLNPRSGRYIKIDRKRAKIIAQKKSEGPYKRIKIISIKDKSEREINDNG